MSDTDKAMQEMLNGGSEEAGNDEVKTTEVKTEEVKTETEAKASDETTKDNAEKEESTEDKWKATARLWEGRAKENKEKADAADALATKVSELEKQLTEATTAKTEVTRWKVAAKYGISEDDVALFLTATDEETLTKQAERLSQTSARTPKPDPAQGNRGGSGVLSSEQQGAAALEGLFQN